ncbi:hypothetical protein [Aestuariivirga sp.]|uniref:hypothetical protein n=1 Tax=Aestuariivirga sp. TaxID=2650926 RepID=UPI003783147D
MAGKRRLARLSSWDKADYDGASGMWKANRGLDEYRGHQDEAEGGWCGALCG